MGLQVDPEMYREQASERLRKGGLTDGQSDALAHEFAGIRTDTDELKTDVSELKTDVSKLKTDVSNSRQTWPKSRGTWPNSRRTYPN